MSTSSPPRLLTVSEVAAELGLSRQRTYALIAEGLIPAVRISPRRVRIPSDAWEAWHAAHAERAVDNLARATALVQQADVTAGVA
jgi:excisionase family DNA binding protein